MSVSDSTPLPLTRQQRIRATVQECLRRRAAGEALSDEHVAQQHTDLMPELAHELRMAALIARARLKAKSSTGAPPGSDADSTSVTIVIPGYHITREIHHGGQGIVYEATQMATKRQVAIKILREGRFASRRERQRFEREVQVLGTLRHPNIVRIYDSGVVEGSAYLVMDYIPGSALDQWIANCRSETPTGVGGAISGQPSFGLRGTPRPGGRGSDKSAAGTGNRQSEIDHLLRLFIKICNAVHAAHLRGIIHRDLKPSNIRVDEAGEPHVLDFGLAKLAPEGSSSAGSAAERALDEISVHSEIKTITGQFVGSLPWAAPEQAEGEPDKIDVRTDVYALGVILYQLLAGRFPYPVVGNIRDVIDNILNAEPERLVGSASDRDRSRRSINDEIETIVLKCLSKERERRYQSAGDLAADLQRYFDGEPIAAKRESTLYVLRKQLRRYRGAVSVAAAFVLFLIVFALVTWSQSRANRRLAVSERMAKTDALAALKRVEQEKLAAEAARARASEQTERYRRSLYINSIARTASAIEDNRVVTAVALLDQCPEDLRRWEWSYLRGLTDSSQATLAHHDEWVTCVAFGRSPDPVLRNQLFSSDTSGKIEVWDVSTGAHVRRLAAPVTRYNHLAFEPHGRWLAAAAQRGVSLLDPQSGQVLAALDANVSIVWCVDVSADGRLLLSSSDERTIKIWDVSDIQAPRLLHTLSGQGALMHSAVFSPDGRTLASAGNDGTVRAWEVETGTEIWAHQAHHSYANVVAFSPDGHDVLSGGDDAKIREWEAASGNAGETLTDSDSVQALAFSPDGRWLASGCYNGAIRIWDSVSRQPVRTLRGHLHQVSVLASRPIENASDRASAAPAWLLASGSRDRSVRLWDPFVTPLVRTIQPYTHSPSALCFSPDSRNFLCGCDGVLTLWDADSLQRVRELVHPRPVSSACFTPDGRFVVSGSYDQCLRVWDLTTGQNIRVLEGQNSAITSLALHARPTVGSPGTELEFAL